MEQQKQEQKEDTMTQIRFTCQCGFRCRKEHYFNAHQNVCKEYNEKRITNIIDDKYYCTCGQNFKKLNYYNSHVNICKIHKNTRDQDAFFAQYTKTSFDDIEYINNVPKVVYVCWFGTSNNLFPQMSPNRFSAFKELVEHIDVPVILLTQNNMSSFIKPEYPLHKSFQYLSGVHKSDYFRCYMLYHYGGGYHDIKSRDISWSLCWNENNWLNNPKIWMFGRREKNKNAIGYPPGMKKVQLKFKQLITMGWIICKPNTPFLTNLLIQIEKKLTTHYPALIKHPATNPAGYYSENPFNDVPDQSYPIRWLEILGELYHPLMLKYGNNIQYGLPDAIKTKNYK